MSFFLFCFSDKCNSLIIVIYAQLPEEARELEKELRQITKDKNEAVRSQDFEKVRDEYLICVCLSY